MKQKAANLQLAFLALHEQQAGTIHRSGTMQSPRSRAGPILCQQDAADPFCLQHKPPLSEKSAPGSYIIHKLVLAT